MNLPFFRRREALSDFESNAAMSANERALVQAAILMPEHQERINALGESVTDSGQLARTAQYVAAIALGEDIRKVADSIRMTGGIETRRS